MKKRLGGNHVCNFSKQKTESNLVTAEIWQVQGYAKYDSSKQVAETKGFRRSHREF